MAMPMTMESENRFILPAGFHLALGSASGGWQLRFALLIGLVGQLLHPFDLPKNSNKERQLF